MAGPVVHALGKQVGDYQDPEVLEKEVRTACCSNSASFRSALDDLQ